MVAGDILEGRKLRGIWAGGTSNKSSGLQRERNPHGMACDARRLLQRRRDSGGTRAGRSNRLGRHTCRSRSMDRPHRIGGGQRSRLLLRRRDPAGRYGSHTAFEAELAFAETAAARAYEQLCAALVAE